MKIRHFFAFFISGVGMMVLALFSLAPLGCGGGGSGGPACNLTTEEGCSGGQVCESVQGGTVACFDPISFVASAVNLETGQALAGVRLVALDENSSPISGICTTDAAGSCELTISTARDANGNPVGTFFLRGDAPTYQTFPGGVRPPFPVSTQGLTVDGNGNLVIDPNLVKIGLIPLPSSSQCTGSISGNAANPPEKTGVLVVAETTLGSEICGVTPAGDPPGSKPRGYTAIADKDTGEYRIFNLPPGSYTVAGYAKGANYNASPNPVTVSSGVDTAVNLSIRDENTATANGNVEFANAPNTVGSSVVFVVESTLLLVNTTVTTDTGPQEVPILIRGESVPGLRQEVTQNSSSFTAEGIPAGSYVVLAAFENDLAVRDPDVCIAGTALQNQFYTLAPGEVRTLNSFKITDALTNPDPTGNKTVAGPNPIFSWDDDSSEKFYDAFVFDGFGRQIWEKKDIPGVSGSARVSLIYGDAGNPEPEPALVPGEFYQFRVLDTRTTGGGSTQCPISQTEDFLGVFKIQ